MVKMSFVTAESPDEIRKIRRRPFPIQFIVPLIVGAVLNPLNSTTISTVLVPIADHYHASVTATAWLITALYLSSAVGQPVMGRIADQLGARRTYLVSLCVVAAAGAIGAIADSMLALILSRMLLGIGTSGAYPSAIRILRTRSEKVGAEPPRFALSLLAFAASATAVAGPALGGILSDFVGWRAIFAMNIPLAMVVALLVVLWVPSDDKRERLSAVQLLQELDGTGILFFAAALFGLMLFLMTGGPFRWMGLLVMSSGLPILIIHSLRRSAPFVDVRMLRQNPALSLTYVRHIALQIVIYGVFFGFPQWLESSAGLTPTEAGLVTVPMYFSSALCSLVAGRTGNLRLLFLVSAASAFAGSAVFLVLNNQSAIWQIVTAGVLFGIPTGLVATASQAALYVQAPVKEVGTAAGFLRMAQYIGAMSSAALLSAAFGHRASDGALHVLALALGATSGIVFVATMMDRTLRKAEF